MAKIDISKIDGYEKMSAEEKLAALEALELPDPDYSEYVKKDVADKYASEAADYKKQLRERMSEEEAAKAKADEAMAGVMAELEQLKADKAISDYTAQFIGIGYDEALAKATAQAVQKGDMAVMFKNHAKFVAEREKALKAELLKDTPAPPAGEGGKGTTKDAFKAMSLMEKQAFAKEHPEEYASFVSGN